MLENDSRENKMKVNCKRETLLGSLQGKQEVLLVAGGTWRGYILSEYPQVCLCISAHVQIRMQVRRIDLLGLCLRFDCICVVRTSDMHVCL